MEVPRWEILKKPFWATQTWPWASFSFFALFDLKTKKFRNLPSRLGRFQQIFLAFLSCDKISPKSGHEWEKETFFISTKKTIWTEKNVWPKKYFLFPMDRSCLFIFLNWIEGKQTNKHTIVFCKTNFWCITTTTTCLLQCDQIGQYIELWATFQSLWQQLFCPSAHILVNFCKVVEIFQFSSEIILSNFVEIWQFFTGHTAA